MSALLQRSRCLTLGNQKNRLVWWWGSSALVEFTGGSFRVGWGLVVSQFLTPPTLHTDLRGTFFLFTGQRTWRWGNCWRSLDMKGIRNLWLSSPEESARREWHCYGTSTLPFVVFSGVFLSYPLKTSDISWQVVRGSERVSSSCCVVCSNTLANRPQGANPCSSSVLPGSSQPRCDRYTSAPTISEMK